MVTELSRASFRDPSGFVFRRDGTLYRQVNCRYAEHLAALHTSGLYDALLGEGLIIPHQRVDVEPPRPEIAEAVIRPDEVPFISYPYEWCFGQLRDAALATLTLQLRALEHDMVLKDASAFNIQFVDGGPLLIDTLSFELYREGEPWIAYRQFCEHFLVPLLLISKVDPSLGKLPALTADGIPLELGSRLLPLTSRLSVSSLLHVHLHARSIRKFGSRAIPSNIKSRGLSKKALVNLVEGLRHTVAGLSWKAIGSEWGNYDTEHGYDLENHAEKSRLVDKFLQAISPSTVWDLGANTGEYSRIARSLGAFVLSADADPVAVERNYHRVVADRETGIHPLWVDLRNPSADTGWANAERDSLTARACADTVLALALVHHLAITGNVPLSGIADWFAELGPSLIIEFVPKSDPQVQRLLVSRKDVFTEYSQGNFEAAFARRFKAIDRATVGNSGRVIYRYQRLSS